MKKIKVLLGMLILLSTVTFATPAQLGLPGTNLPQDETVNGIRLNLLWGKNTNMKGLDLSILALSQTKNLHGVQFGLFLPTATYVEESFNGISVLQWANVHTGKSQGFISGFVNYTKDMTGAQFALVNISTKVNGIQTAFVNVNLEKSGINYGFVNVNTQDSTINTGFVNVSLGKSAIDLGLVNYSGKASTQVGLINITNDLEGAQLGFINFARNGFFPVFPFFNIDGRLWF
jgi:hypothetical protein